MKTEKTFPVYTFSFWSCYFIQMRPYLLFVSGIAGLSGLAFSTGFTGSDGRSLLMFLPFFTGYGFGQALTDCFQTDTDKLSAPYRPLSKGIVSIKSVLIISSAGLLASGLIFYLLNPVCFYLSLGAVAGLATYSYVKKKFVWAGPFYNAWIVALLPVMGFFSGSGISFTEYPWRLFIYVILTFFSYASFVLIGYLKDIEADKATGYRTFPVVFGWNKTIITGDIFAVITLSLLWIHAHSGIAELVARILAMIIIVTGQYFAHFTKNKTEKGALVPILSTVRGFILIHISIVLHARPEWWIASVIYYGVFEWALYKRPSQYQV